MWHWWFAWHPTLLERGRHHQWIWFRWYKYRHLHGHRYEVLWP